MLRYVLKRLLYLMPTILLISVITFGLSSLTAGDPVEMLIGTKLESEEMTPVERAIVLKQYKIVAHQYHLDLPKFYCSVTPANYPDTLYKIAPHSEKEYAIELLNSYGSWASISSYRQALAELSGQNLLQKNYLVNQLTQATNRKEIKALLQKIQKEIPAVSTQEIQSAFEAMIGSSRKGLLIPKFTWHGFQNQYHHWFSGILHGDFGYSLKDKKPVLQKILSSLPSTLWLNITALLFAIFLGIGTGVYLSTHPNKRISKLLLTKMYAWLSIPSFWLASLLVIFLTTNDYGSWTNLFPSGGIGVIPDGASFFQVLFIRFSHLFLPVISLTIPLAAVLAIQMRRSLSEELEKTYIKTAILKGIPYKDVIWKHGVRNALFPILTMFGMILPSLIGGSVVVESIFNIPGMGRLLLGAIYGKDWPIVFAILMITAILTVVSLLLTDLLYTRLDPRIDLVRNEKLAHD